MPKKRISKRKRKKRIEGITRVLCRTNLSFYFHFTLLNHFAHRSRCDPHARGDITLSSGSEMKRFEMRAKSVTRTNGNECSHSRRRHCEPDDGRNNDSIKAHSNELHFPIAAAHRTTKKRRRRKRIQQNVRFVLILIFAFRTYNSTGESGSSRIRSRGTHRRARAAP